MRRWSPRGFVALTAAVSLLPAVAWAAEGGGGSPWFDLFMKFVNFAILVGVLFWFLRKPVAQGLSDRRENIRRALEEARQAKADAEARHREAEQKIAALQQEVRRIQEEFRQEGERQRQQILADTAAAVEAVRRQAEAAGANEVKRARDELRTEAAELAVSLAGQKLAQAYGETDQKKDLQRTIENVEELH